MAHLLDSIVDSTTGETKVRAAYRFSGRNRWHGLGIDVPESASIDEIAEMIGADVDPVAQDIVTMIGGKPVIVPGYRAIVDGHGRILSVMSANYKVHTPKRVLEFFKGYYEAGGVQLAATGFLKNGAVMWASADVPDGEVAIKDELVKRHIMGVTSFDGSLKTQFRQTDTCTVCWNTLTPVLTESDARAVGVKHNTELTDAILQEARKLLSVSQEHTEALTEIGETLADTPVSLEESFAVVQWLTNRGWFREREAKVGSAVLSSLVAAEDSRVVAEQLLNGVYAANKTVALIDNGMPTINDLSRVGKSIIDALVSGEGHELEARNGTAWGLLQAVTDHVDYRAGRDRDTAVMAAWNGVGNKLKNEALELLLNIADAKSA